jgi:cytochrome b involved in lipid metabolism
MAITSSSNEHLLHHQLVPLHHQSNVHSLDMIDSEDNLKNLGAGLMIESAESLDSSEDNDCDACPHCADRCGNEKCLNCYEKCLLMSHSFNNFMSHTETEKCFTICQIRRHNHAGSAWLVVGDGIYDATQYIDNHPGGRESILKKSGGAADCSVDFDFHSRGARRLWRKYKVGTVCNCPGSGHNFGKNEQCIIC